MKIFLISVCRLKICTYTPKLMSKYWNNEIYYFLVQLADGVEFSFTDKRRFAKVRLLENVICETVYQYVKFAC